MADLFRILVIGGYGHFGGRVCASLCRETGIGLIVAGRDESKAISLIKRLPQPSRAIPLFFDHTAQDISDTLRSKCVDLVIHTSGPFQDQDYHVAEACVAAGCHYVDLADSRRFVADISALHNRAVDSDVLVVSGASTVPGISAVVVDELGAGMTAIQEIETIIAPAQKSPRGIGTVKSVLSYCGKAFDTYESSRWGRAYGWQGMHRVRIQGVGRRWSSRCDVPDLELFPSRYPTLESVHFYAALGSGVMQWGLWVLAVLVRLRIVRQGSRYAKMLKRWGDYLDVFGDETGAMRIRLTGNHKDSTRQRIEWTMIAESNHGPEIPCIPAIILAKKLSRGAVDQRGARPCVDLFTLSEVVSAVSAFDISFYIDGQGL